MDLPNDPKVDMARFHLHFRSYFHVPALLLSALLTIVVTGCDSVSDSEPGGSNWLIPQSEVVDGGPGKDGIPSIDFPNFEPVSATSYVPDFRLVVGVKIGDEVRAYPHQVLDWHEIVNDEMSGVPIAMTYCPLTGTATAWNRTLNGSVTEFGVSGKLFRNNLLPYDRETDSNWSQMQLRSVSGSNSGSTVETYQVVETTWKTWKAMFPDSEVLTTNTGFARAYQTFTYGSSYSTDPAQILFPIRSLDGRLGRKVRVHGIIPTSRIPKVYPITDFTGGVRLIEDTIDNTDYIVVGSAALNFAVAFELDRTSDPNLTFSAVQDALPVVMEDSDGNRWDVFGTAVTGRGAGRRLKAAQSYTGYWFGWADFYPGLQIYDR